MSDVSRERKRAATPREVVSFRLGPEQRAAVERLIEAKVFLTPAHFYEEATIALLNRYPQIAFRVEEETDHDAA